MRNCGTWQTEITAADLFDLNLGANGTGGESGSSNRPFVFGNSGKCASNLDLGHRARRFRLQREAGPLRHLLGTLQLPEPVANLCFGGTNQEMLFLTAGTSLYGITRRPDLVVTAINLSPATPHAGQSVRLTATVKNQGTAATPAGTAIRVAFSIGSETNVVWSDSYTDGLPPDASVVLTANDGVAGSSWLAREGAKSIFATADDGAEIKESLKQNNSFMRNQNVAPVPADSDGDGMSDRDESAAGTDPRNVQSALRIQSLELLEPGRVKLTWASIPNKKYRVAALSSVTAPDTIGLTGVIRTTNSMTSKSGGVPSLGRPVYFRITVVP